VLFANPGYTGGFQGTVVGKPTLFGWHIDALDHPARYALVALAVFVIATILVANLRRSPAGRRMIAIRGNDRAAASLGISIVRTKLLAFAIASVLAALGGILIGFQTSTIVFANFGAVQSIYQLAYVVIGGIGYVFGPLLGSLLSSGSLGSLLNPVLGGISNYLPLIGGISVVLIVMFNPDGMAPANSLVWQAVSGKAKRLLGIAEKPERLEVTVSTEPARSRSARPRGLDVSNITVRFGGVTALSDVSFSVKAGEIVGLIGPNGAGKTTMIDVITGFVRQTRGDVRLDGRSVNDVAVARRVEMGLARSWQSLELFEDISVIENLLIASELGGRPLKESVASIVRPSRSALGLAASSAIADFELDDHLQDKPSALPYGRRRLVGVARSVALDPGILLLDEPAAGLGGSESRELGDVITRLARTGDMGILLVEHDVDLVMGICDRVVVLDFGRKIAEGSPHDVRSDQAVIDAYLGTPDGAPEADSATAAP